MDGPVYLTVDDVVALHDLIMERTGSPPCPLLRPDPLESAIARPQWAAHYEGADLVRQATLLAVGISQAQAFEDGNKRAAFAAVDLFLRINGWVYGGDTIALAYRLELIADPPEGFERDGLVENLEGWLRRHTQRDPDRAD